MNKKAIIKIQNNLKSLIKQKFSNTTSLKKGQKVKLNIKHIKENPDYKILTDKYKNWIDDNSNRIFTVEHDDYYGSESTLVCLKEDKTSPKWIFWDGDLEIISKNSET